MQQITISPATFKRLQSHAEPLVDTTESVINRALDALERPEPDVSDEPGDERLIDPLKLPNMKRTKILVAAVDGNEVGHSERYWNRVMKKMICLAVKHGRTLDEISLLCAQTTVNGQRQNIVNGQKQAENYAYLPDINVSLRNRSADGACRTIMNIAQNLGIALDIVFEWRDKQGAAYPGQRGRLRIPGSASA